MRSDLEHDDPNTGWVWFVAVVGSLFLIVCVYFASGLYYAVERRESSSKIIGESVLLEETTGEARRRLQSWNKRLDDETKAEYVTMPIERAMRTVQAELKSGQGR